MNAEELHLTAGKLTLPALRRIVRGRVRLTLDDVSWKAVARSRQVVEDKVEAGEVTYGVNTGFGLLAQTRIADDQLESLQKRLLMSHATGVGEPLDEATAG